MALSHRPRVLSEPCEVFWAGFRSDTYRLQQAGWEIAAEESPYDRRARLMLRHGGMKLYAVSEFSQYDYYGDVYGRTMPPVFHVIQVANRIEVIQMTGLISGFRQIDAAPQVTSEAPKSVEDLGIFATPMVRTEEIIVEPADVSAMLEQIRKMQSPEQKEIRARERSRERTADPVDRQVFHAQILSFSGRAA